MSNIDNKISSLSTIPLKNIESLHNYINCIHSHDIVTEMLSDNDIISIDTFEGKIVMSVVDDTIKYKFIPSEEFIALSKDAIIDKKDMLITNVSKRLQSALVNTYKDML